ncbi:uncharacterized protein [Spinacia oleracea]|uniref:RNase H type-1 domain-containing protein n=1 Tax=Spinacia oleracea TaxID=3562 RepID=A0ABM3RH32_SPIOL|nr:uncharacterized protein LOC130469569 [Spinacia oleracea]
MELLSFLRKFPETQIKFVFVIWEIWKERNNCVFKNRPFNPIKIYFAAISSHTEWSARNKLDSAFETGLLQGSPPSTSATPTNIPVRWYPPPQNHFKLNFDGSRKNSSAAVGFIIRDHMGQHLSAATSNIGNSQVYMAEALALHKGIKEAIFLQIKNLRIEGDNLLVINTVKGIWATPWKLDTVIKDIKKLLSQHFDSWEISHIYREANQAADWIANVGHLIPNTMYVEPGINPMLSSIISNDYLGVTHVRRAS